MKEVKNTADIKEKTINNIDDNETNTDRVEDKKKLFRLKDLIILFIFLAFISIVSLIFNWNYIIFGKLNIKNISMDNYNIENNNIKITINVSNTLIKNKIKCYLSIDNTISEDDKYEIVTNNKCEFIAELKDYYIILEDQNNNIVNITKLSNYINKSFALKTNLNKVYLAIGAEKNINLSLYSIGNIQKDITWNSSDTSIATVEQGKITGISDGTTDITANDLYGNSITINVTVTSLIDNYVLKNDEPLLKGTVYSLEEANLLDEILFARIAEAGVSTRAGAVAAARFLTLEFPYAIPYFFENGRLNSSGTAFVDGEGRYYHKGLYLHKSKFETIEASLAGPAIWGMPLTNYEDSGRYVKYARLPNGLDCSGFVSWALLNGGFDPGDYGAGESIEKNQMTDLGEFVLITQELINSGEVKTGDLINFWGHIGIIIGIDDENYYVAETLDTFGRLVVKTYKKTRNLRPFTNIVLMDSYYKEMRKLYTNVVKFNKNGVKK